MKDIVSICVPIYNTEQYLVRCIDSLLAQTYRDIEIVLVDDGSIDRSGSICDAYASQDPRVKVVHQSNTGEAGARNAGLRAAVGKYVMFIDSDDEYLPNAVQLLVDAMADDGVDLAIGGYIEKRGDEQHFATGHQRSYSVDEFASAYLSSDCPYGVPYIGSTINAKLFRKSIIDAHALRYDERFIIGNDAVFICAYLQHTNRIFDVFAPIYIYYKFQPEERVQGMAWYYPDGFFLFAYVADRMIRLAHPDSDAYKKLIEKQYIDFLYALINAITNEDRFQNGVLPYLFAFCPDLDFLQACAALDLTENIVRKDDDSLPVRLISELIVNKNYQELYALLKSVARLKQIAPYTGDHARRMIRLNDADFESPVSSSVPIPQEQTPAEQQASVSPAIHTAPQQIGAQTIVRAYESELQAQREELAAQKTVIDEQQALIDAQRTERERMQEQINFDQKLLFDREAEIQSCHAEIASCRQEIEVYRQSTSWRITKPLRTLSELLHKK